jgi:poly [ADP-ribose] polymerase
MLLSLEVHETRSRTHATEEGKAAPKRQKAENNEQEGGQQGSSKNKSDEPEVPVKTKKLKGKESELNGKENATKEFTDFCKAIREHLSVEDMRKILEANEQDASGSEDAVVPSWYVLFEILNESFLYLNPNYYVIC